MATHNSNVEITINTSLNEYTVYIFQWIMFAGVCMVIGVFGVVSNTINIICFIKQGFKDPVNVSLMGLAISDLGCLTTIIWINICCIPVVTWTDLEFDPIEFQYLTSAVPHATFTRITSWITALITLERCLCITAPIKIKGLITSKRVFIIIMCIFLILIASVTPVYVVNRLGFKFFPARNRTLIGLFYSEDREKVENISFGINNICIPLGAFLVIIICTIILVIKLKKSVKWRKISTAGTQIDSITNRNLKVAKMVVMISALFLACFIPLCTFFIAMIFEPELSVSGKYRNILLIFAMLVILLESVNSSVNIFFYYRMSSRYRVIFCEIFSQTDSLK